MKCNSKIFNINEHRSRMDGYLQVSFTGEKGAYTIVALKEISTLPLIQKKGLSFYEVSITPWTALFISHVIYVQNATAKWTHG